jgi:hypothetical protein
VEKALSRQDWHWLRTMTTEGRTRVNTRLFAAAAVRCTWELQASSMFQKVESVFCRSKTLPLVCVQTVIQTEFTRCAALYGLTSVRLEVRP